MSAAAWNILVVDDEPDVHAITGLALKRRTWRSRSFELTSAKSGKEARAVLAKAPPGHFQVALVDVVMETDEAGLELCRHIRETYPRSLRLVLRTGQPGVAPEEKVLNEFDIDFYLAKVEATPEKLYAVVRAGLRASQDIATILALKEQLQGFTRLLQKACTVESLVEVMDDSLRFLEGKFAAKIAFLTHVTDEVDKQRRAPVWTKRPELDYQQLWSALVRARSAAKPALELHGGEAFGLRPQEFVALFPVLDPGAVQGRVVHEPRAGLLDRLSRAWRGGGSEDAAEVTAGVAVEFRGEISDLERRELVGDLSLFLENWKTAFAALCLQEDVAQERVARERDRLDVLRH